MRARETKREGATASDDEMRESGHKREKQNIKAHILRGRERERESTCMCICLCIYLSNLNKI